MATYWATNAGAGSRSGTSLADAFALPDAIVFLNALLSNSEPTTLRICGDCSVSAMLNVNSGSLASVAYPVIVQGRNAGDTSDAAVTISGGGGAFPVWGLVNASYWMFRDIIATGTDKTSTNYAWSIAAGTDNAHFVRCQGNNAARGFHVASGSIRCRFDSCSATGNSAAGFHNATLPTGVGAAVWLHGCASYANGSAGFVSFSNCCNCMAYANSGAGYLTCINLENCVAYANSGDGVDAGGAVWHTVLVNCVLYRNGGYGVNSPTIYSFLRNCALGENTSGNVAGTLVESLGQIDLTEDPFVDGDGGDFALLRSTPCIGAAMDGGDLGALQRRKSRIAQPVLIGV